MHLLLLIIGSMLLPEAYALRCYECKPDMTGSCVSTEENCLGSSCGSLRVIQYVGGKELADVNLKTCMPRDQCVDGSFNYGIARTVLSSSCCTSDLCNTLNAQKPAQASANGKSCYVCNGNDCTKTLACLGNEDRCISATVATGEQSMTLKGCASKSICTDDASAQMAGISSKVSCCEGNMCNSARAIGVSLLLLVAPMVSFGVLC